MMDAGTEGAHMTGPEIRSIVKLCCVVIALAKTFWFSVTFFKEETLRPCRGSERRAGKAERFSPTFLPVADLASTKAWREQHA